MLFYIFFTYSITDELFGTLITDELFGTLITDELFGTLINFLLDVCILAGCDALDDDELDDSTIVFGIELDDTVDGFIIMPVDGFIIMPVDGFIIMPVDGFMPVEGLTVVDTYGVFIFIDLSSFII